jgi:aryl-alcohol dehydrogenase-like predicted oxidoreductase
MQYQLFGRLTGLRVSELALGTGMFGTGWGYGAQPDEVRRIFAGYADAGGNFIDTADVYQYGQSETLVGECLAGIRNEFVLATKYTSGATADAGLSATGNSRLNMIRSLEASLKRLKTDRIDLYWVHMPDGVTPTEEIVRGLDDLARAGKIIYAGLSNFPAWRISRAATIAELRGSTPIVGLQTEYSLVERTPERELLPMAEGFGLGIVGWSPLGGGLLTGKYRKGEKGRATETKRLVHDEKNPQKTAILDVLHALADEVGVTPGQVATRWVSAKGVIPIIGNRTRGQLDANLAVVSVTLTADQIRRLDDVSAVPLGSPHELTASVAVRRQQHGGKVVSIDPPKVPVI